MERFPKLPNELKDRIGEELEGLDLFHYTLVSESCLGISTRLFRRLLMKERCLPLDKEVKKLFDMKNSSYILQDGCITVLFSSLKCNTFIYGPFNSNVILKSLKYYSTSMFSVYCRLWSFNPFYYESSYPTLEVFKYSYLLRSRSVSDDEAMLFNIFGNNQNVPKIVTTLNDFRHNLNFRYEFDAWSCFIDWDSFVIAGGSVVCSLLVQSPDLNGSDIDLFFLKQDTRLFRRAVDQLETRLKDKYFIRRKTLWWNRLVQFELLRNVAINDIFDGKSVTPSVVIQLVRPTIENVDISRILYSFGLDVCGAAFNSKEVVISFSCLQALNTGHTTCNVTPVIPSDFMRVVARLYKYQRRGFNVLCPKEFDIKSFLAISVQDCNDIGPRMYRFRRRHFGDNCDAYAMQRKFIEYYDI